MLQKRTLRTSKRSRCAPVLSLWQMLTASAQELRYRWLQFLHAEKQPLLADQGNQNVPRLMALLRQTPWWRRGHLYLAAEALRERDTALAYASGQAALLLATREVDRIASTLAVARALLASRSPDRAALLLEPLHQAHPGHADITEELAACFLGKGDFLAARGLLESLPRERRTSTAEAALAYLRTKEHTSHDH